MSKVTSRTPLSLRLARAAQRRQLRGSSRAMRMADELGLFRGRRVRHRLPGGVEIDIPIHRHVNRWDSWDVQNYERGVLEVLADVVRELPRPQHLVDGGADVGTFSALAVSKLSTLTSVTAIEPNPLAFEVLEGNIARLPISGVALHAGLADRPGRGVLRQPRYDDSEHAAYVELAPDGDIEMLTIDGLGVSSANTLIIKLDVEGAESIALAGARSAVAAANRAVVVLEAHRRVAARTGVDPIEPLRLLAGLRSFKTTVVHEGEGNEKASKPPYGRAVIDMDLDLTKPFFSQVPEYPVYYTVSVDEPR